VLVKCPECQDNVSDTAKLCPHCGYPIRPSKTTVAKEKASAFVGTVIDFCKGVPRKKTLRCDISRQRFFERALHNIRIEQSTFPKRIRDYRKIGDGSVTSEGLIKFSRSIEVSRQILVLLASGNQDAKRDALEGLIYERDISPYVECLTPVVNELIKYLKDDLYAAGPPGLANLVKNLVSNLLDYEDVDYRVEHKLISDEEYVEWMYSLRIFERLVP
jgi:hypothetical protein